MNNEAIISQLVQLRQITLDLTAHINTLITHVGLNSGCVYDKPQLDRVNGVTNYEETEVYQYCLAHQGCRSSLAWLRDNHLTNNVYNLVTPGTDHVFAAVMVDPYWNLPQRVLWAWETANRPAGCVS